MAKSTEDAVKKFYPKLLEILPVDRLITQFYSKQLLSSDHKRKLDALSTHRERTKYFLDEVVEPSVKIDFTDHFDEMLIIMENSDDPAVKFLAKNIREFLVITPPSEAKIFRDQESSRDTETQSK